MSGVEETGKVKRMSNKKKAKDLKKLLDGLKYPFDEEDHEANLRLFRDNDLGIGALGDFLGMLPEPIEVEDESMIGLINVLNLLGCTTDSGCSGHDDSMAFICFPMRQIEDLSNLHEILLGTQCFGLINFYDDVLKESREEKVTTYKTRSADPSDTSEEVGIRIDIDVSEFELILLGAYIFFWALVLIKFNDRLGWNWKIEAIKKILQGLE